MDKKEIRSIINELAQCCHASNNEMLSIEGEDGFSIVVHALHYFEYMLDDRNCCSYVIEGIEDYCRAHSIVSNDPIMKYMEVTTDGKNTFTMEFNGDADYRSHYWGKLTLATDEDEWALCFNLAGEKTKIAKDPESGCFVRYLYPNDGMAVV